MAYSISQADLLRFHGREAVWDTSANHWGASGFSAPLIFSIYNLTCNDHKGTWLHFYYHCYASDTQLSFKPDDPTVSAPISAFMKNWMKMCHLQLNLAKTELLVIPANPQWTTTPLFRWGLQHYHYLTSCHNMLCSFSLKLSSFQDWTTAMIYWPASSQHD